MSAVQTATDGFWRWLDYVADAVIAIHARVVVQRAVRLVETQSGQFLIYTLDKRSSAAASMVGSLRLEDGQVVGQRTEDAEAALRGGRIDLVFQAERFLFKPLELPSRAADFLDGVIRAHIDRLTPWKPEDAAFGCSVSRSKPESGPHCRSYHVTGHSKSNDQRHPSGFCAARCPLRCDIDPRARGGAGCAGGQNFRAKRYGNAREAPPPSDIGDGSRRWMPGRRNCRHRHNHHWQ